MSGIEQLGEAFEMMAESNIDNQTTVAKEVFFLIGAAFPKAEAWSEKLAEDQAIDFRDNLLIAQDPRYAAQAAADYAQYTMDSSAMDLDTSNQNRVMQCEKTEIRTLGNGMDQVYNLAQSPMQQQKSLSHIILSFASMN